MRKLFRRRQQAEATAAAAPAAPARARRPWRRAILWAGVVFAVIVGPLALWYLPSLGVRYVILQQLRGAGLSTIDIAEVSVSLTNGQFGVKRATANAPEGPEARLDDLAVLFEWTPLLNRRVALGSVSLQGLRLDLGHDATGRLVVSGLPLPEGVGAATDPSAPSWLIGMDRLQIADSILVYTRNSQRITLAVDLLVVERLRGWEPEASGHIEFVGSFNGAPVAISGEFAPFAAKQHADLRLTAQRVDLARIAPIFADPELSQLQGELDFSFLTSATVTPGASVVAAFEGTAELRRALMKLGDIAVTGSQFNWSGRISSTPGDATVAGTLAGNDVAIKTSDLALTLGFTETAVEPFYVRFGSLADLAFSWKARFDAEALRLNSGEFAVAQGSLSLALEGKADGPRFTLTAGAIDGADIAIRNGKDRVDIAEAAIATERLSALIADPPQVDWDGHIDIGGIAIASGALKATQGRVDWDGKVKLDADGDVNASGTLTGTELALAEGVSKVAAEALKLSLAPLQFKNGRDPKVNWKGRFDLTGGSVAVPGLTAAPANVAFDGRAEFDVDAPAPGGRVDGKLTAGRTRLQLGDLGAWVEQQAATVTTAITLPGKAGEPITARTTASVTGITAGATRSPHDYLSLGRIDVEDARISATGAATIGAIKLTRLQSIQRRKQGKDAGYPWRAELARAALGKITRFPNGDISATGLDLDGLMLRVTNTPAGLNGWDALPASPAPAAAKPPAAAPRAAVPAGRGPRVAIGHVEIKGDSRIAFEDRVPAQGVRMTIAPLQLRVDNLDSVRPLQPSPLRLTARIGEFTTLRMNGTVKPFAPKLNLDVRAQLTGFNLPSVSPYAAELLGVNLDTGRFDGEIAMKVVDEKLDGTTTLKIANLDLSEVTKGEARLAAASGMPIETVVGMLRDGDGLITLRIPITGELSDPQFDLSQAIGQAISGAVRETAETLLSVVFPVVPLLEAVGGSETRRGLDLKPVDYPPGNAELGQAQRGTLDNLAKLLAGRPGLHLNVCGFAGPRDWPPIFAARVAAAEAEAAPKTSVGIAARQAGNLLRSAVGAAPKAPPPTPPADPDALGDLASERARAAKAYLAAQGVGEERLFECRPEVETDDAAKPRAEIRF